MNSATTALDLIPFFIEAVKHIFDAISALGKTHDSRSLKSYVMEQSKAIGLVVLEVGLKLYAQGGPVPIPISVPCACGQSKHHKGKRAREIRCTLGPLNLEERHYYYCDQCRIGGRGETQAAGHFHRRCGDGTNRSAEAQKRGVQSAEVLVFGADGAAWVWKTAQTRFPKAIQVMDWYHTMEHIWAVGRAKFGNKE